MTCPHGYESPACPRVGCESSRPARRLSDWTVADASTIAREHVSEHGQARAAIDTHRGVEALAARDNASGDMTRGKGFIGVREDGRTNPGALPWWWCYGHQPIAVKGAVYTPPSEQRRFALRVTEAAAERSAVDAQLAHVAAAMPGTDAEKAQALGTTPQRAWRARR